jgi:hypothetical protein
MAAAGGKPDYIAVTLDVSGDRGTFRSELYKEYKANRPEIPEAMPPQIERCMNLLKEIGVPLIGAEGFEADDESSRRLVTRLRNGAAGPADPDHRQGQGPQATSGAGRRQGRRGDV